MFHFPQPPFAHSPLCPFNDRRINGHRCRSGGHAVPHLQPEEEGRRGVVQVLDVEGEPSSGAGECVRIDFHVIGDAEVHLLRDSRQMANRRLGLRRQLLYAETG